MINTNKSLMINTNKAFMINSNTWWTVRMNMTKWQNKFENKENKNKTNKISQSWDKCSHKTM